MSGPRISLCLIVKNEEKMLHACLASVRDAVDEIVVVDTGSTDASRDIASAAGAKIVEFEWCDDFAAARNVALEHATGAWILQLDADERLVGCAAREIRRAARRHELDLGMLRFHDANAVDARFADVLSGAARLGPMYLAPRLMRKTPDLKFTGVIHEHVTDWLVRNGNRMFALDVDVVHLGGAATVVLEKSKHERNLRLLRKRIESEPGDPTAYGYLCWDHIKARDFDEAARVANEGWEHLARLEHSTGFRPSILRLAVARAHLHELSLNAGGLFQTAERAIAYEGQHPNLLLLRARGRELLGIAETDAAKKKAHFEAALQGYRASIERRVKEHFSQDFIPGGATYGGWTRVGMAHLLLGETTEAIRAFDTALSTKREHREALLGRAEARINAGQFADAMKELQPLLDATPDPWLLAALAVDALGNSGDARLFLIRAVTSLKAAGNRFLSQHRMQRLEVLARRYS